MALPKSLLCVLGDNDYEAERLLRAAGFATALLHWKELAAQPGAWMELAAILEDPAVYNLVVAGDGAAFSSEALARLSLIKLGLSRQEGLSLAIVTPEPESLELPEVLADSLLFKPGAPLGAKLMARRFQPDSKGGYKAPFFIKSHLDPLIGLWLEIAPRYDSWCGFMLGVTGAEITAFGVGPGGVIPQKSTLAYPMLGIKGDIAGEAFSACAAKNTLSESESCFCRIDGIPTGVFVAGYPDDSSVPEMRFPMLKLA